MDNSGTPAPSVDLNKISHIDPTYSLHYLYLFRDDPSDFTEGVEWRLAWIGAGNFFIFLWGNTCFLWSILVGGAMEFGANSSSGIDIGVSVNSSGGDGNSNNDDNDDDNNDDDGNDTHSC